MSSISASGRGSRHTLLNPSHACTRTTNLADFIFEGATYTKPTTKPTFDRVNAAREPRDQRHGPPPEDDRTSESSNTPNTPCSRREVPQLPRSARN
ncbi:hypothetical protein PG997_001657 [Apiospora hydei]|uniref:Uncharacterized protein n=1 Tax=Apiospora hydei TaxID=1337664 RepID=A0ABR1XEC5_9PEZI